MRDVYNSYTGFVAIAVATCFSTSSSVSSGPEDCCRGGIWLAVPDIMFLYAAVSGRI